MLNKIIDTYGQSVYRLALSVTRNPDLAEDIYQKTFLLLVEKRPVFKEQIALKVWLLTTARKLSHGELRKTDNNNLPLESAPEISSADASMIELFDMLDQLDEIYREPITLFYIEDMSITDIAKTLGISRSAVKTRLHRGRNVLEKYYKEELL